MPFASKYPEELSTDQRRELETLLKITKHVKVYRRAKVILYLYGGRSTEFIWEHTGYNRRSQYYWLSRYSREGIEGLYDHPRSGRPLKPNKGPSSEFCASEETTLTSSPRLSGPESLGSEPTELRALEETTSASSLLPSGSESLGSEPTPQEGLSQQARFTLQQMYRNHPKAYLRHRAKMVLLGAKGYALKTISDIMDSTPKTVGTTLSNYDRYKLGGLYRKPGSGKPAGLLATQFTQIQQWLTEGPKALGYRFAIWTTRSLRHQIYKKFNRRLSREWIRQNLHDRYHYSWTRAKKFYAYRNSQDRQAFQHQLQDLLNQAQQEKIILLLEDETILDLYGSVGYSWSPIGQTQQVLHPGKKDHLVVFGAVNPQTLQSHYHLDEVIDQTSTLCFLKQLHGYYHRHHCQVKRVIVLDKHPGHRAEIVTEYVADNKFMELVFTPTQSPDLHPIERLWDWFEDQMIKNAFFETVDDLKKATKHFFSYIAGIKEQVIELMGEALPLNTG
jgi:transposase